MVFKQTQGIFSDGKYYDKFISIQSIENLDTRAELPLNYTTEDGINFNGSIDRIDQNPDGTCSIYDYKTGTDNSGITKSGQHSDYLYQIGFYKYLYKKDLKDKGLNEEQIDRAVKEELDRRIPVV